MNRRHALILDIGHRGKPSPRHHDRGAVWGSRTEVDVVELYDTACHARTEQLGGVVLRPPLPAWYRDRQLWACGQAAANPGRKHAFLAEHMNFGLVRHAILAHDRRSRGGRRYCEVLADLWRAECPWFSDVQVHAVGPADGTEAARSAWMREASGGNEWKASVYALIRHVYEGPANIFGVVVEPGGLGVGANVDPDHLAVVGYTMAEAARVVTEG